ncbi:hypothetical protein ACWC4J_41825 [Streptomyces sp. NPDC001356]
MSCRAERAGCAIDAGTPSLTAVSKPQPVHGPRIDLAPSEAWQHLSAGAGAKGEREVRHYMGRCRHITPTMLAHAFLAVMAVQK